MFHPHAENAPDRRPAILVCVYEADDPARLLLDETGEPPWTLSGARTVSAGPDDPAVLADLINGKLARADCHAVLLVGRTRRSDGFRIQMRAENRSLSGGAKKWSDTGPALARATAPVSEIVRCLMDAGLSAVATSDSEDDAGSYLLYRVLTALPDDADAPAVALVRAPLALDVDEVRQGIEIAAGAIVRHLSLLPRGST